MTGLAVARAQGAFNVASGLWPLLHMRSFEAVSGPKVDRWLVRTVAGLLTANGLAQLTAAPTEDGLRTAAAVGIGTAATLAAVDAIYVPAGRISPLYLVDAAAETGWLTLWAWTLRKRRWR